MCETFLYLRPEGRTTNGLLHEAGVCSSAFRPHLLTGEFQVSRAAGVVRSLEYAGLKLGERALATRRVARTKVAPTLRVVGLEGRWRNGEVSGPFRPRRRTSSAIIRAETSLIALYLLLAYRRDACATACA